MDNLIRRQQQAYWLGHRKGVNGLSKRILREGKGEWVECGCWGSMDMEGDFGRGMTEEGKTIEKTEGRVIDVWE